MNKVLIIGNVSKRIVQNLSDKELFSMESHSNSKVKRFSITETEQKEIKENCIREVTDFYNKHDTLFLEMEAQTGVNIWFLEQFRLNHNLIGNRIENSTIHQFLNKYKPGEIVHETPTLQKRQMLFRVLKELVFSLKERFKRFTKIGGKTLIIHNNLNGSFSVNELFGNLTDEYPVLNIRALLDLKSELPDSSNYKDNTNFDTFFSRCLFKTSTWYRLNQFSKELNYLFRTLNDRINDSSDREIFNLIKGKKNYFKVLYLRYLAFDYFLKRQNSKNIILSDENSPQQKVIQYAAAKNQVNVFAIQHGAIYKDHFAYSFGRYHSKPLLPTITFTWGKHYTNELLEFCGYKENNVRTVGSVRKSKVTLHGNYDKDQILYATQPQPNEFVRKKQLVDVLRCMKEYEDKYILVIRPHPKERDDEYFIKEAVRLGVKNYTIDRSSTLEQSFQNAGMLITAYSTVGAEFIEYFKPLIVLDYDHKDLVSYIKEGVGIRVDGYEGLLELLKTKQLEINKEKYSGFIKKFFYKSDGNASQRIIDEINKYE